MDSFNRFVTTAFDILLYPFGQCAPVWGLLFVSALAGVAMLWGFGRISNQKRVRALKASMKGHLLEVWIFRDQLPNVLKAEGRVMRQTGKYLLCSLPAFAALMLPVVVVMIQLQARYGYRPLRPAEHVLLKIRTTDLAAAHATTASASLAGHLADAQLQLPTGLVQETPALRIPQNAEVDFRVGAATAGQYEIGVKVAGETVNKTITVGTSPQPLSPERSSRLLDRVLAPLEPGLPPGPITSVEVHYPAATVSLVGFHFHWAWPFLVVSMLAAYALKGLFGVEL